MSVTKNSQLQRESFSVLILSRKILISLANVGNKMFSENSRFVMLCGTKHNMNTNKNKCSVVLQILYPLQEDRSSAIPLSGK